MKHQKTLWLNVVSEIFDSALSGPAIFAVQIEDEKNITIGNTVDFLDQMNVL